MATKRKKAPKNAVDTRLIFGDVYHILEINVKPKFPRLDCYRIQKGEGRKAVILTGKDGLPEDEFETESGARYGLLCHLETL